MQVDNNNNNITTQIIATALCKTHRVCNRPTEEELEFYLNFFHNQGHATYTAVAGCLLELLVAEHVPCKAQQGHLQPIITTL